MLKYNNNHIFTGYLKQLLSSFSLPACKVYTKDFVKYVEKHGQEDPRVLKSFDSFKDGTNGVRINYLKNNEVYNYYWKYLEQEKHLGLCKASWRRSAELFYSCDKKTPGLTRSLDSPGISYDNKTHEYLGDYLRFIRDYYNINLMSLYNCFTDKIYNNIYFNFTLNPEANKDRQVKVVFNAHESDYRIYAFPVKLFAEYTIAIDCDQGIEMFCGLYNSKLDMTSKAENLAARTYQRVHKTIFKQPFLYDKLNVEHWPEAADIKADGKGIRTDVYTRWDLTNREKDLKLFIKVPTSCRSSITILEGDYREFNNYKYSTIKYKADGTVFNANEDSAREKTRLVWNYQQNHCVLNFNTTNIKDGGDGIDLNKYTFTPISPLQLLAFNTGESYPFADRLVEYLGGSTITPIDEIPDNIKRVQRVARENNYYFKIEGLWENKLQNILYDYMMNSGPVEVITIGNDKEKDPDNVGKRILNTKEYPYQTKKVLVDKRYGNHPRLGHTSKSALFDVLGYVDKDVEKWYASWRKDHDKAVVGTSLQSVDIYDGLYDI